MDTLATQLKDGSLERKNRPNLLSIKSILAAPITHKCCCVVYDSASHSSTALSRDQNFKYITT